MVEHEFYSAVGDLVDALSDELAHEVCFAPEVRDRVAHVIGFLGDDYQGYLRSWWLIDAIPRGRRARDAARGDQIVPGGASAREGEERADQGSPQPAPAPVATPPGTPPAASRNLESTDEIQASLAAASSPTTPHREPNDG